MGDYLEANPTLGLLEFLDTEDGMKLFKETLRDAKPEIATFKCLDNRPGNAMGSVTLTVTDSFDESDSTTADVMVLNRAPTVSVTGTSIDENESATVEFTVEDPGVLDTFDVKVFWVRFCLVLLNTPVC